MNATPQFGAVASNSAAVTNNLSLDDFLFASSATNVAASPDFKTIAAPFFANSAAIIPAGQLATKSLPPSPKLAGAPALHERGSEKDDRTQHSDSTLLLAAVMPTHVLNIPPELCQVASHPQISAWPKQDAAQIDSLAETTTLPDTTPAPLPHQAIPRESQPPSIRANFLPQQNGANVTSAVNQNIFQGFSAPQAAHEYSPQLLQKPAVAPQLKNNKFEGLATTRKQLTQAPWKVTDSALLAADVKRGVQSAESFTPPTSNDDTQTRTVSPTIMPISEAFAKKLPGVAQQNNDSKHQVVSSVPEIAPRTDPASAIVAGSFPSGSLLATNPRLDKSATNQLEQKVAPSADGEFIPHQAAPSALHLDQISAHSKKTQHLSSDLQTTANNPTPARVSQSEPPHNQVTSTIGINQSPQPSTDTFLFVSNELRSGPIKSTVTSNENAMLQISLAPETNSRSANPTQPNTESNPAPTRSEAMPVQLVVPATESAPKNDANTRPSTPNAAPAASPAIKSGAGKIRNESTSKLKVQRNDSNDQTEISGPNAELHQREIRPISAPHAADAGTAKTEDAATPLISVAHAKSASATIATDASGLTSSTTQITDVDDAVPTTHTSINTAKLVQELSQSELRLGLQTRDFGNIDIRTSVSRHEFSAQISVEHNDVARTLTTELPGLYARLNEQQVAVNSIHIQDQSLATSSGLNQQSQQTPSRPLNNATGKSQLEPALPAITETLGPADRLDIRI